MKKIYFAKVLLLQLLTSQRMLSNRKLSFRHRG